MFNITADRVLSICNEILKQKLKITWSFRGRVDQVNEEMFKLAKAAGCRLVLFGIEDYTNENLKNQQEHYNRTIHYCNKIGKKI